MLKVVVRFKFDREEDSSYYSTGAFLDGDSYNGCGWRRMDWLRRYGLLAGR